MGTGPLSAVPIPVSVPVSVVAVPERTVLGVVVLDRAAHRKVGDEPEWAGARAARQIDVVRRGSGHVADIQSDRLRRAHGERLATGRSAFPQVVGPGV